MKRAAYVYTDVEERVLNAKVLRACGACETAIAVQQTSGSKLENGPGMGSIMRTNVEPKTRTRTSCGGEEFVGDQGDVTCLCACQ